MRLRLVAFGILFALSASAGLLLAASGVVSIAASGGHWRLTTWLLEFAMRRSIALHSLGVEAPPALDQPSLVMKGAAHYEIGCVFCHGSPVTRDPKIARKMLPPPPYLPPVVNAWEPHELFYIVKHGIKLTGMPAWPTQKRDDEVWAMVAFLRELPRLDATQYSQLSGKESERTRPPEGSAASPISVCTACHGVDGLGRELGAFPRLAGQRYSYLVASLQAFAAGERHSGIMEAIAATLSRESMEVLARHYSDITPADGGPTIRNGTAAARGEAIARHGIPAQRVPACFACHGPGRTRRNPLYPDLAAQPPDYLVSQLTLFKEQRRGGTRYAHLMREVAGLTAEQMHDVAHYYATLPPARGADRLRDE